MYRNNYYLSNINFLNYYLGLTYYLGALFNYLDIYRHFSVRARHSKTLLQYKL